QSLKDHIVLAVGRECLRGLNALPVVERQLQRHSVVVRGETRFSTIVRLGIPLHDNADIGYTRMRPGEQAKAGAGGLQAKGNLSIQPGEMKLDRVEQMKDRDVMDARTAAGDNSASGV